MSRFLVSAAILAALLIFFSGQAPSQGLDNGSLARLFVRAQEQTGVPSGLLAAIAIQESSFNPWSLNLAGQGKYPTSFRAALWCVEQFDARSFDIGLMQINSAWLERFDVGVEQAIKPGMNVLLGSLILRDCLNRHGLVGGVACYHSGRPEGVDGIRYARKVLRNWKMLETGVARVE